jgi:hypothetical protein
VDCRARKRDNTSITFDTVAGKREETLPSRKEVCQAWPGKDRAKEERCARVGKDFAGKNKRFALGTPRKTFRG